MKRLMIKVLKAFRRRGIKGVIQKSLEQLPFVRRQSDLFAEYAHLMRQERIPLDETACEAMKGQTTKLLNWVLPEIGEGSGGHTNLFRFISLLEGQGFHSRVYLYQSVIYQKRHQALRRFVAKHFPVLDPQVEFYGDVSEMTFAHAVIATAWETAYFVRRYDNAISKFYFVQDYEPYFYPKSFLYQFAERTYCFGLRGITAGEWLKDILWERHGMECTSFSFSYEKEIYTASEQKEERHRIFFYGRPSTERRDFEIGLLACKQLCERMPQLEVIFAGEDLSDFRIPFRHQNRKVVSAKELAEIYRQCDLCLVLSSTNLSLLPLEIMGAGSVPVCSKGEHNTWLVDEENAILVEYDPVQIAEKMEYYLKHPKEREVIRRKGNAFARQTSWEQEGKKVGEALRKGIEEDGKKREEG